MSLHPQLVDHLTQARQGPPLHALTIGEIRADMAAAMAPLHQSPRRQRRQPHHRSDRTRDPSAALPP